MNAPMKEWYGHSWVGWLNLIFLRWFFVRLAWKEKTFFLPSTPNIDMDRGKSIDKNIVIGAKWTIIFRVPWRW